MNAIALVVFTMTAVSLITCAVLGVYVTSVFVQNARFVVTTIKLSDKILDKE